MNKKDYILGTDTEELLRLGFQHRVWASEAFNLWERAGLKAADTVLDVGSGPGFAALDIANLIGSKGTLIAVDRSKIFLDYLENLFGVNHLNNFETIHSDIYELELNANSIDFAYSRWVFSWLNTPESAIKKIGKYIKTGGRFALQEYCYWGALNMEPLTKEFRNIYKAARKSWDIDAQNIDIGYKIPEYLKNNGFKIIEIKPLTKIGRPGSAIWNWISSFMEIYGKKLVTRNILPQNEYESFIKILPSLAKNDSAYYSSPQMIEIIAEKV